MASSGFVYVFERKDEEIGNTNVDDLTSILCANPRNY